LPQGFEVEQLRDAHLFRRMVGEAVHAPPVVEVLLDAEMRKQPRVLEHISDAPAVRRDMDAPRRVVEGVAVDLDPAAVRLQEPGDHVDQRGLAGA
jgi:hypothetical protein